MAYEGYFAAVLVVFSFDTSIYLLVQGDVGPFNASLPTEVPLWVAIFLKQRRKCRIQPPDWMDVGKIYSLRTN